MSFRIFLAALILAPLANAADLQTIDGRKLTGDIVSIVGSDLTFKAGSTEEKFLVTALHSVTVGKPPIPFEAGKRHTLVEFVDGSSFRCTEIVLKDKNVELKLLGASPRTLTVPLRGVVYSINREAGDLKLDQDFRGLLRSKSRFDLWITKRQAKNDMGKDVDQLDGVPGTFGDADEAAKTVKFTFEGKGAEDSRPILMSKVSGMILAQKPGATSPAICKVIDLEGNELVAQAVTRTEKGYAITTVTNVKIELTDAQVSKFDFAAGAIKYLSDLDPVALEETGTDPEHYQKDTNLDKRPIRLVLDPATGRSETYPKGLTLKAKTVITYELKAQYKSFRALAGVDNDPDNAAASQVKITVDDGTQVLFKGTVKRGEKPLDLNLGVQNVDRLKITIESDGTLTDLGNQVSLANARVLK